MQTELPYGGAFVPETAVAYMRDLEDAFISCRASEPECAELRRLLETFVGRPTPLHFAARLTAHAGGARIYFKREDLGSVGSLHSTNVVAQMMLARKMGRRRILVPTGSGLAAAAAAAACRMWGGLECVVYMGAQDLRRQPMPVQRARILGATINEVDFGAGGLREAVSTAMQDWVTNVRNTYFLLTLPIGPRPYPDIIRWAQSVIGEECRRKVACETGGTPSSVVAALEGGGGAIGLFSAFLDCPEVRLIGVQAGGSAGVQGAVPFERGRPGAFHGFYSWVMQDEDGQVPPVASVGADMAYPAAGPDYARLHKAGRAAFRVVGDAEAIAAARLCAELEGIVPGLEAAHAVAAAIEEARELPTVGMVVALLCADGHKDLAALAREDAA